MPQKKRHGRAGTKARTSKSTGGAKKAAPAATRPATKQPPTMSAHRRAQLRRRMLIRIGVAAAVLAITAFFVVRVLSAREEESSVQSTLEAAGCTLDTRADDDGGPGENHRNGVTYEVDPPAGGDHNPSPLGPGRYSVTDAPDDRLVHSMEHGYVVIWYSPGLPQPVLEDLADLQGTYDRDTLLVERPTLDVAVAATAWHQRALCDRVDTAALADFIEQYRNKGPEDVPH